MTLGSCLALSSLLFCIGVFGALSRRSFIGALISIELMLNACLINFIAFARFGVGGTTDVAAGPIFAAFAVAVTSAEVAVALAIIVALHRRRRSLDIEHMDRLHG